MPRVLMVGGEAAQCSQHGEGSKGGGQCGNVLARCAERAFAGQGLLACPGQVFSPAARPRPQEHLAEAAGVAVQPAQGAQHPL